MRVSGSETSPAAPADKSKQDLGTYSLRGLAIILMVVGHVVGADRADETSLEDGPFWQVAELLLGDVRMPLFTVLSGYVYAMRPIFSWEAAPKFARGKFRRLYIPVLVVGTVFFLVQAATPGTNTTSSLSSIWRVWTLGYAHFWFALALLGIFLVVLLIEPTGAMRTKNGWLICVITASVLWAFIRPPASWGASAISGFFYLLPYFLVGVGLRRFDSFGGRWGSRTLLAALGMTGLVLSAVFWTALSSDATPVGRAFTLVCVVPVLVALVRAKDVLRWRPLAWPGQFAYGIYLLHVFGTAGMRIALSRLGVTDDVVYFAACLIAGLTLPVLVELVLAPHRVPMLLIFGQRPKPRSAYMALLRRNS